MSEIWKSVPGYKGKCKVSNTCKVKRLAHKNGSYSSEKILKQSKSGNGYLKVTLNNKTLTVHRLIALAFIKNPENKPQINHKNGIRTDNRVENLEWCSSKENVAHAIQSGIINRNGEDSHFAKLSENDVIKIKRMLKKNISSKLIAIKFGVRDSTISMIKTGRNWKHI